AAAPALERSAARAAARGRSSSRPPRASGAARRRRPRRRVGSHGSGRPYESFDAGEPAVRNQPVDQVRPGEPGPGEPLPQLALWRDDGGTYARDDELAELGLAVPAGECLVPPGELARVAVRLEHDAPGNDRAAALERRAEPAQLGRAQPELGLE